MIDINSNASDEEANPQLVFPLTDSIKEEKSMARIMGDLVPLSLSMYILKDGTHANQHTKSHNEPQKPSVGVSYQVCGMANNNSPLCQGKTKPC